VNTAWLCVNLAIGFVSGVFYFYGLWLTIRRLPICWSPALWLLASFALRAAVTLSILLIVTQGRWERIIAFLLGLLLARMLLIRRVQGAGLMLEARGPAGSVMH
jgi:F1F0 ATPase subunit 2